MTMASPTPPLRRKCGGDFCDLARSLDPDRDLLLPNLDGRSAPEGGGDGARQHPRRAGQRDQERRRERDRGSRLARRVLSEAEMKDLDGSGNLVELRASGPWPVDPFGTKAEEAIPRGWIESARREHRPDLARLTGSEGVRDGDRDVDAALPSSLSAALISEERWREIEEAHRRCGGGGGRASGGGGPSSSAPRTRGGYQDRPPPRIDDSAGAGGEPRPSPAGDRVEVCGVCCQVYRILDRARLLLLAGGGYEGASCAKEDEPGSEDSSRRDSDEPGVCGGRRRIASKMITGEPVEQRRPKDRGEGVAKIREMSSRQAPQRILSESSKRETIAKCKVSTDGVNIAGRTQEVFNDTAKKTRTMRKRDKHIAVLRSKILLAHQDSGIREESKAILEKEGCFVQTTGDGCQCKEMLKAASYDVLLVEKDLPSLDAFEVTKWIRKEKDFANVEQRIIPQIIILTEDVRHDDLRSYVGSGMDGCLRRPIDPSKLISTIKEAVQHQRRFPKKVKAFKTKQPLQKDDADRSYPKKFNVNSQGVIGRSHGAKKNKEDPRRCKKSTAMVSGPRALVGEVKKRDPNLVEGTFEYNENTSFPFMIMDSSSDHLASTTNNANRGESTTGNTFFNMIVCHDIFDTQERLRITLSPIIALYSGIQILLWNCPGQASTEFSDEQVLNNEFHAACLDGLIRHIGTGPDGERRFNTDQPFYLMGHGSGAAVASYFAAEYRPPGLRGLLFLNGLSFVDPHYASVMHDCRNVFSCSPKTRPDLPIYFYSRFLFSAPYLGRTSAPLALNLYTAVHNPIQLRGRVQLCDGALNHVDVRPVLRNITAPIISVHGDESSLVRPLHAQSFLDGRRACGTIHQALKGGSRTVVIMLKGGHELLQEQKKNVLTLVEQLLTGYHEMNDRQNHWSSDSVLHRDEQGGCGPKVLTPQKFEDKFLDAIVGAAKNSKESLVNVEKMRNRKVDQKGSISWEEYKTGVENAINTSFLQENRKPAATSRRPRNKRTDQVKESFSLLIDPHNPAFERQDNNVYKSGGHSRIYPNPEEYPEVSEYMSWRLKRNRKRLARLEYAARTIQNSIRVFMAKTMVARLFRQNSALLVQRCLRGHWGRGIFLQRKKELWAAYFVQRASRGHIGRLKAQQQRQRLASQVRLAKRWRGIRARKVVKELVAMRNRTTTTLQCLWRKYKAKIIVSRLRKHRNASIEIQRVCRGYQGRRKAEREREKYLFSRSQSSGIELGRQMLAEHKLHAIRLQSEISIMNQEKQELECRVDQLLDEMNQFEEGVRILEKEMHQLSKAERDNVATLKGKLKDELRDQKV